MMQKNEDDLLRPWLAYHAYLFGPENLYVFDNGSDSDRCHAILDDFSRRGVHCDRSYASPAGFDAKGALVGDLIRQLDATGDFDLFLPLDCDEFVCLQQPDGAIVAERDAIRAHLAEFLGFRDVLQIRGSYFNAYPQPRRYYFFKERATLFTAGTIASLDRGFHDGRWLASARQRETALVHLHYHNTPFALLLAHAREKLRGRVADFEPATLRAYHGDGAHLIHYFLMSEARYLANFRARDLVHIDALADRLAQLGFAEPFAAGS